MAQTNAHLILDKSTSTAIDRVKGAGQVGCALALLQDLVKQLGKRFFDLVVGDALYLQAPFVKEVEALGLDWACTLKQNQPDLLREAERLTATAAPIASRPCRRRNCLSGTCRKSTGRSQIV